MASISLVACAQSVNDDGPLGPGDDGDDQGTADTGAPDTGHHDYNNHDSGAAGDTGGGNAGDASVPPVDSGSGPKDAAPPKDSGPVVTDAGNNNPDTGPVTGGGTTCGSNSKYITEYLAALLDPNAVICTDGSECSSSQCCEVDTCVGL